MTSFPLDDRQKAYEHSFRHQLPKRMPIIMRLDGKGFSKYTKGCDRPFDTKLMNAMDQTAIHLCKNIPGSKIAYTQSDEITILIFNKSFDSQSWFDGVIQKMTSISAALASTMMTSLSSSIFKETKTALFDSRVFIVPEDEVLNNFEFRQQDAIRNSVQMLARSIFSHKECNLKKAHDLHEMLFEKGIDWNNLPIEQQRGRCIVKVKDDKPAINKKTGEEIVCNRTTWIVDKEIPIFHKDRDYIEKFLK